MLVYKCKKSAFLMWHISVIVSTDTFYSFVIMNGLVNRHHNHSVYTQYN